METGIPAQYPTLNELARRIVLAHGPRGTTLVRWKCSAGIWRKAYEELRAWRESHGEDPEPLADIAETRRGTMNFLLLGIPVVVGGKDVTSEQIADELWKRKRLDSLI